MNMCNHKLYILLLLSSSLLSHTLMAAPDHFEKNNTTIVWESSSDLETTVRNLKNAVVGRNFRLIREQSLDQGFVKARDENRQQHIIYFCNFSFLNRAMAIEPRIGLLLPYRITVVKEKDGRVLVYAVDPWKLSKLFKNTKLDDFSKQLSTEYHEIIEEAAL